MALAVGKEVAEVTGDEREEGEKGKRWGIC